MIAATSAPQTLTSIALIVSMCPLGPSPPFAYAMIAASL